MYRPNKGLIERMMYAICTFASLLLFAQPLSSQIANRSHFHLGVASFANEDRALTRLEVYVRITNDQLQFITSNNNLFVAEYEVVVDVFDANGLIVEGKEFKDRITAGEIEETSSSHNFHISTVTFLLPPEDYDILVDLQDMETMSKTIEKISVSLTDYSQPDRFVSDIVTLDAYSRDEENNLVFQPRLSPEMRLGSNIYLFFEVYDVPEGDDYEIIYDIKGPDDKLWSDKIVKPSAGSISQNFIVITGDSLRHGDYQVALQVKYNDKSMSVEQPIRWYIEGLPLSFHNINEAVEALRYIAAENEYNRLMKLEEHEKYAAYLDFWNKRDPSPDTPDNELRKEYYARIEYANEHYRGFRKEGWKTDMGLVYVKLGAPDSIDRNPYNTEDLSLGRTIKAIEVWHYTQYSRRLFFVDENGYGDYRLTNRIDLFDMLR